MHNRYMEKLSSKIGDIEVFFNNSKEFHSIKKEVFSEECYYLELRNEPKVIIDIGAHIGLSVLYFKNRYPNTEIVAFEPDPQNFTLLTQNTSGFANVEVVNRAVTSKIAEIELYIPKEGWHSNSSLLKDSWSGVLRSKPVKVSSIPLKKIIDQFDSVDILKIDIEGYEYSLLKEADLEKVRNLLIEFHPSPENRMKRLMKKLRKDGFKISFLQNGKLVEIPDLGELSILRGVKS